MIRPWLFLPVAVVFSSFAACGGDETDLAPAAAPAKPAPARPKGTATAAATASADAVAPDAAPLVLAIEFTEADFVESDESRDPFRSFAGLFVHQAKARTVVQRRVSAGQYALDELRLTGLITRGSPRALFVDPAGLGWVLRQGDYVGKPELVSTGGPAGVDVALNWRVDRVRETDVVFLREDPSHPEIPSTTRVMYLHPVETGESGITLAR